MSREWITKEDYKKGYKRVNIQLPLDVAIRLNSTAQNKGIAQPGTLAKMFVYEGLNVKVQNGDVILPGQTELFTQGKKGKDK